MIALYYGHLQGADAFYFHVDFVTCMDKRLLAHIFQHSAAANGSGAQHIARVDLGFARRIGDQVTVSVVDRLRVVLSDQLPVAVQLLSPYRILMDRRAVRTFAARPW